MKKIINDPNKFVDEMVEGILLAAPEDLKTPGSVSSCLCVSIVYKYLLNRSG
ncbi:hypothetical protein [Actinotignum sp. GS-2025b]|uniref:hypothetical protein n=1 Tax=Actinotignum sp. GS-2025b TaxID=3427275 RepID=UPI003F45E162